MAARELLVSQNTPSKCDQSVESELPSAVKAPAALDVFQVVLLLCGVLTIMFSLVSGMNLQANSDKYFSKATSNISSINRLKASMLPTSATPEVILAAFSLYSFKKRRHILKTARKNKTDKNYTKDNKTDALIDIIRSTIITIAIALFIFSAITGFATTFDHREGSFGFVICFFICSLLIVPLLIGFMSKNVRNSNLFQSLIFIALCIEIYSFSTIKPIFAFNKASSSFLWEFQMGFYEYIPVIILVAVFFELYKAFKIKYAFERIPSSK
jgi:hypothetical protein